MPKILLVDDSKVQLMHITRMLVSAGHEVIATTSGRTAVEHVADGSVDLILSDLYMPEFDGFELVEAVRVLPEPVPLIVMSSNALACDVFRDARALGAAASLTKPFTEDALLITVNAVLAGTATEVGLSF